MGLVKQIVRGIQSRRGGDRGCRGSDRGRCCSHCKGMHGRAPLNDSGQRGQTLAWTHRTVHDRSRKRGLGLPSSARLLPPPARTSLFGSTLGRSSGCWLAMRPAAPVAQSGSWLSRRETSLAWQLGRLRTSCEPLFGCEQGSALCSARSTSFERHSRAPFFLPPSRGPAYLPSASRGDWHCAVRNSCVASIPFYAKGVTWD